ncbi:Galactose mutarotase-like protein [Drosera capensis]
MVTCSKNDTSHNHPLQIQDGMCFRAIVGHAANRIGGAKFTLNGKTYTLHGFSGKVRATVSYMFIGTSKLVIRMKAKALNKPTPINLAFHGYWNLGGHNSGNILDHEIQLFASKITPVTAT